MIVRDATSISAKITGTTTSLSHTVATGASLLAIVMSDTNDALPSGVTYNGVAMSLVASKNDFFSNGIAFYFLAAPVAGVHNIVPTYASSQTFFVSGVSYTGLSSTQPDSTAGGGQGFSVAPLVATTTVVASNSWLLALGYGTGSGAAVSGNLQTLTNFFSSPDSLAISDSNGIVGTGPQSISWSNGGGGGSEWLIISISPSLSSTNNLTLLRTG